MYDYDFDRRIERMARKQCGAFSHAQAIRAGGSDAMLHGRLQTGQLLRIDAGVYALASYPGNFHRQCWAAVLGSPGAGVAGLAAAHLAAFPGFGPGRPEIVVGPGGNARSSIATVRRYDSPSMTTLDGLRITSPAQTLFDIAPRVAIDRLERAIDDLLLTKRLTVADLEERLAFYDDARRAGLRVMRRLVAERRVGGIRSAGNRTRAARRSHRPTTQGQSDRAFGGRLPVA